MLHWLVPTRCYAIMLKCPLGNGSSVVWLLENRLCLLALPWQRGPAVSLRYWLGSLKPLRSYMSGWGMNSPCCITLIPDLIVFPLRLEHGP